MCHPTASTSTSSSRRAGAGMALPCRRSTRAASSRRRSRSPPPNRRADSSPAMPRSNGHSCATSGVTGDGLPSSPCTTTISDDSTERAACACSGVQALASAPPLEQARMSRRAVRTTSSGPIAATRAPSRPNADSSTSPLPRHMAMGSASTSGISSTISSAAVPGTRSARSSGLSATAASATGASAKGASAATASATTASAPSGGVPWSRTWSRSGIDSRRARSACALRMAVRAQTNAG